MAGQGGEESGLTSVMEGTPGSGPGWGPPSRLGFGVLGVGCREGDLNDEAAGVAVEVEGGADDEDDAVLVQGRRNHRLHQLGHLVRSSKVNRFLEG